eukprot:Gb_08278 [translate_table: standard]
MGMREASLPPKRNFWKLTWNPRLRPKVAAFFLLTTRNKIPTLDNFKKKGIAFPNICPLCDLPSLLSNWHKIYPKSLKQKPLLKESWLLILPLALLLAIQVSLLSSPPSAKLGSNYDPSDLSFLSLLHINPKVVPPQASPVSLDFNSKSPILSFYGASTSNPGDSGGGGVIISPSDRCCLNFRMGLGSGSSIATELNFLIQGL